MLQTSAVKFSLLALMTSDAHPGERTNQRRPRRHNENESIFADIAGMSKPVTRILHFQLTWILCFGLKSTRPFKNSLNSSH